MRQKIIKATGRHDVHAAMNAVFKHDSGEQRDICGRLAAIVMCRQGSLTVRCCLKDTVYLQLRHMPVSIQAYRQSWQWRYSWHCPQSAPQSHRGHSESPTWHQSVTTFRWQRCLRRGPLIMLVIAYNANGGVETQFAVLFAYVRQRTYGNARASTAQHKSMSCIPAVDLLNLTGKSL